MSSQGSSQTTTPTAPKWAKQGLKDTFNQASDVLGQSFIGNNPLLYGANADQQAGWDAARQAAGAQQGTLGQQQAIFGNLANFGSTSDPVLQQRLQDIATLSNRNLNENIMPALRTGAVQAGQAGSSREGIAQGIAARGALEQTARSQNDLLAQAQQQRLQALGEAGNMGGNLLQQQLMPANTLGMIGGQQRDIQNQMAQEQLMRQQAEIQRLQGLQGIQQGAVAPLIGQTTSTPGHTWGTQDYLQAGAGLAMATMM